MAPTTIALVGLVALLVLIPTRRLYLAGWRRESLTAYFLAVWLLGAAVAVLRAPATFLVPILLVAYLAPFVAGPDAVRRLVARGRGGGSGGADGGQRPMKNVTPPDDDTEDVP